MAAIIQSITPTGELTDTAHGTTRTRDATGRREGSMDHTAGLVSVRATTLVRAHTRAARLLMVHTERAALRRLITRAPAPTRKRARAQTCMEVGARRTCNAETIG